MCLFSFSGNADEQSTCRNQFKFNSEPSRDSDVSLSCPASNCEAIDNTTPTTNYPSGEESEANNQSNAKETKANDLIGSSNNKVCQSEPSLNELFPVGLMDADNQQIDLRGFNSWKYSLCDVPLKEMLDVLTINALGPFILISKLKGLMVQSPNKVKFIVNVSAMEGQFHRKSKSFYHPHTNMAKAALNMLTRTSGIEFRKDKIYMTAVDTGWVTDERPFHQAMYEQAQGFQVPLDTIDGASRVYHPIAKGLTDKEEPYFAVFLKDYKPSPW